MSKKIKRGLYLFLIAVIATTVSVSAAAFGVSAAKDKDSLKFTVNTVEGASIEYLVTSPALQTVQVKDVYIPLDLAYGELTIPETVINPENDMEYSVTSIGVYALSGKSMTSVTIPDSVEYIEDMAFYNCLWLENVYCESHIPASVDSDVFEGCPSNLKIYIPQNTTDAYVYAGWPEDKLVEQA